MGNKVNSNIFRLSKTKNWKSKHFEKKTTETAIYNFKDLEIRTFIVRFFKKHGLIVNNCKLNYSYDGIVHLFISYFITFNSVLLIKEARPLQNLKFLGFKSTKKNFRGNKFKNHFLRTKPAKSKNVDCLKDKKVSLPKFTKKNYKTSEFKSRNNKIAILRKDIWKDQSFNVKKCRKTLISDFCVLVMQKPSIKADHKIKFYINSLTLEDKSLEYQEHAAMNTNPFIIPIPRNKTRKYYGITFLKKYLRARKTIVRTNSHKSAIVKKIKLNRLKYFVLTYALSVVKNKKFISKELAEIKIRHNNRCIRQLLIERIANQFLIDKIKKIIRSDFAEKILNFFKWYKINYLIFCAHVFQDVNYIKEILKKKIITKPLQKKVSNDLNLKYFSRKSYTVKKTFIALAFLKSINKTRRRKRIKFCEKNIVVQRNIRNLLIYKCLFNSVKIVKGNSQLKKNRLKLLKYWKTFLMVKKFNNIKTIKINSFLKDLFKSLNLFTNDNSKICLTLQQLNKNYYKNFEKKQIRKIKLSLMKFHYYRNNKFFKEGINALFIAATAKSNTASIISTFIAEQLPKLQKHHYLLNFVSLSLRRFISRGLSKHYGIKIQVKGRFNGRPRSTCRYLVIGKQIPFVKINSKIDYSEATAFTIDGSFGIKVWVCYEM